eukprot:1389868-Amorphochlora_amoeboformis.AAC.1
MDAPAPRVPLGATSIQASWDINFQSPWLKLSRRIPSRPYFECSVAKKAMAPSTLGRKQGGDLRSVSSRWVHVAMCSPSRRWRGNFQGEIR